MRESVVNAENTKIKKRILVSQKRQITIPIEFFNALGIDREVECFVQDETIVLRPITEDSGEFDEQILAELIGKGISGSELLEQFKIARRRIRPAVENMLANAQLAAEERATYSTYKDVFEPEKK